MAKFQDSLPKQLLFGVIFTASILGLRILHDGGLPVAGTEQPYPGVKLTPGVIYATSRHYNYTILDWRSETPLQWLMSTDQGIRLVPDPPIVNEEFDKATDIIVLVHGYKAREDNIVDYFPELLEELRSEKKGALLVVYNWHSIARHWEDPMPKGQMRGANDSQADWEYRHYNVDKLQAEKSGAPGFAKLIGAIKARTSKKITIIAHSMGNRVVLEAIRRRNDIGQDILWLIMLAAAVDDNALEEKAIAPGLAHIGKIHIFYSRHDLPLNYGRYVEWRPQLGYNGPSNPSALPRNVKLYDVTEALGEGEHVHSEYLMKGGIRAISLMQILR